MKPLGVLDFETDEITPRPHYPPKPVGVALRSLDKKDSVYISWGHPKENTHTLAKAKSIIKAWCAKHTLICHNANFDLDVAETHLGIKWPQTHHDTLLLGFLDDPDSPDLRLKSMSKRILKRDPGEQDAIRDYVLKRAKAKDPLFKGATKKNFAGYIAKCPGGLVGRYAMADVDMTAGIFKRLYARIKKEKRLLEAYQRELQLTKVLIDMERRGVPIDVPRLKKDIVKFTAIKREIEAVLLKKLKVPKKFHPVILDDYDNQDEFKWTGKTLGKQLLKSKLIKTLPLTEKGNPSMSAESLTSVMKPALVKEFKVRSQIATCINTFMKPWYEQAKNTGLFFARFNQVRSGDEWGSVGAKTGRLSMSPNLQNVIRSDKDPRVPKLRDYIIPGRLYKTLGDRDYCFSDDTEVLTDEGWKFFKDLDRTEKVAQWKCGKVTFAKPLAYQAIPYEGDMINIVGDRTCNLLVSPNHNCLLLTPSDNPYTVKATDYRYSARQLNAGVLLSKPKSVEDCEIAFTCAIQADAKLMLAKTKRWKAVFYLKKTRKIKRLKGILNKLLLPFTLTRPPSKTGFVCVRVFMDNLPYGLRAKGGDTETFTKLFDWSALFKLDLNQRQMFLRELQYWDGGSTAKNSWTFGTVVKHNADVVQGLAPLSGIRITQGTWQTRTDKTFYSMGLSNRTFSHTKMYEKTHVPYNGMIYCVTMPHSTVIVRRKGRVVITGNSQQELRILANYEDGPFKQSYIENPRQDAHQAVCDLIAATTGLNLGRRSTKDLNFGLIYGQGLRLTAIKMNLPREEAARARRAHAKSLPGIPKLQKKLKDRVAANDPIFTWGGRRYFCEKPIMKDGRFMSFEYRMLNKLIQGSAADMTKQAMINYSKMPISKRNPILLQIHDSLILGIRDDPKKVHMALNKAMLDMPDIDIPMLSDGKLSTVSWHQMKDTECKVCGAWIYPSKECAACTQQVKAA